MNILQTLFGTSRKTRTSVAFLAALALAPSATLGQTVLNGVISLTDETVTYNENGGGVVIGDEASAEVTLRASGITVPNLTGGHTFFARGVGSSAVLNLEASELNPTTGSTFNIQNSTATNLMTQIGAGGTATINVNRGTLSTRQVALSTVAGSLATINVTGEASVWNLLTWYSDVARAGTAAVNVTEGGRITNAQRFVIGGSFATQADRTGVGSLLVDGPGSSVTFTLTSTLAYFAIGRQGTGAVTVSNGGSIAVTGGTDAGNIWIGTLGGSSGTLDINTGGKVSTQLYLSAGNSAPSGELEAASGVVNVDGAGSELTVGTYMYAGNSGHGALNITNGGRVALPSAASGNFYVSRNSFNNTIVPTGAVLVSGENSRLEVSRTLYVAAAPTTPVTASGGIGNIKVGAGGAVVVGRNMLVYSGGTVTLEGGTISLIDPIRFAELNSSEALLTGYGVLNTPSLVLTNGASAIGTGAGIAVSGTLSGSGLASNLSVTGLAARSSEGALDLENVTLSLNAPVTLTIDALAPAGLISFDETTSFAGTHLVVAFDPGYLPENPALPIQLFDYVGTGTANYAFASVTVPDGYTFANGVLSAPVSGDPLSQWRIQFFGSPDNSGAAADQADPDGDGIANLVEYAIGSDPTVAGGPGFVTGRQGGFLTLSFNRIADPLVNYSVLGASSVQGPWTSVWSSSGLENVAGPVTVSDNIAISAEPRRFLRLSVSYGDN
jgi:T5SS/PEP-CTERM-associated repeat protein